MVRIFGVLAVISLVGSAVGWSADEWPDFVPPANSGVVNVKEYGAKGDGIADDTAAIRSAIWKNIDRSRYAAPPMIYLPAGTYRLSGPIEGRAEDVNGWSSGWRAGFLLVGQGRGKTTLKLDDACAGYTDSTKPKWVVATGSEADGANGHGGGNRAFRHCIANMTINVGAKNPGAIALDFITNNRGTVENVRLFAPPDSGHKGLAMDRNWPGPALIKHLEVQGFEQAFSMGGHWQYSMTFEDIVLKDQRRIGFTSDHNPIFMRGLIFSGSAPVCRLNEGDNLLTLIDATIVGATTTVPAISTKGFAYVRNLRSTGFATVIDGEQDVVAKNVTSTITVSRWTQGNEGSAVGGKPGWLDLPIEETPLYWAINSTDWVDGSKDIQAAIDSGKPIVYLPNGSYTMDKTIEVRGKVRKIVGFQSSMKIKHGAGPLLHIGETDHPVIFEHLWLEGDIRHDGKNAVAFRHVDFAENATYHGAGPGKSFLDDVIGKWRIGAGHHLWARQTNAEFGDVPLFVNEGGTAWILGYKTEGEMTCFKAVGGKTEILGGLFYPLRRPADTTPAIDLSGGAQFAGVWVYNGDRYHTSIRITEAADKVTDVKNSGPRGILWSTRGEKPEKSVPAAK